MQTFLVLALISLALVADQWWTRRRIRRFYAIQGMWITRIVWQPFKGFLSREFTRQTRFFQVFYTNRQGEHFSALFVVGFWDGFYPMDVQALHLSARAEVPRTDAGKESPRTSAKATLASYLAVTMGCAVLTTGAIGLSYWTIPHAQLNLPDGLYGPGLWLVFFAAIGIVAWQPRRAVSTGLIGAGSVLAVVIIRVVLDVARDPSSHNLLGIEVIIAAGVGAVVAGAGVGCGLVVARARR